MAWVNEIYDTLYDPNTVCVACISYGADSLAMLRAIKFLGLPLHRIVHTEVWATQTIHADLPPMVEFKKKADEIIFREYGIVVEHVCATRSQTVNVERERESRYTYEDMLTESISSGKFVGTLRGFPLTKGSWCKKLKYEKIDIRRYILQTLQGRKEGRKETSTDSRRDSILGAQENSSYRYGFPMLKGEWYRSILKPPIRISGLHPTRPVVSATQTLFQEPH